MAHRKTSKNDPLEPTRIRRITHGVRDFGYGDVTEREVATAIRNLFVDGKKPENVLEMLIERISKQRPEPGM